MKMKITALLFAAFLCFSGTVYAQDKCNDMPGPEEVVTWTNNTLSTNGDMQTRTLTNEKSLCTVKQVVALVQVRDSGVKLVMYGHRNIQKAGGYVLVHEVENGYARSILTDAHVHEKASFYSTLAK